MRRNEISAEEYEKIKAEEKATQDKQISRKLKVLMLRYEGKENKTIAERTGFSETRVSHLITEYKKKGLKEYARKKYGGNHRNMTKEEEEEILEKFRKDAEAGHVVTAQEIKKAFNEKLGRDTGSGYIYMLLARHGWRKVMPRSRHPRKANEKAKETSKKLRVQ